MRTWKAANPPRDAGRRRALGKPMLPSWFLGLLLYAILSSFPGVAWGVQVVTGGEHSCAILDDGSVKCWGWNTYGQLGLGTNNEKVKVPTAVNLGSYKAISLCLGEKHMCVVLSDGSAKCTGDNTYGQLGDELTGSKNTLIHETSVVGLGTGTTTSITCGAKHNCAILSTGEIRCWGSNSEGQLGLGPMGEGGYGIHRSPEKVIPYWSENKKAVQLALGLTHSCALIDDGSVHCWGGNHYGQMGSSAVPYSSITAQPKVDVPNGFGPGTTQMITSGPVSRHACAVSGGKVMCWGSNTYGQVGVATLPSPPSPPLSPPSPPLR